MNGFRKVFTENTVGALCTAVNAEGLGNGGAGDIGVQNSGVVAAQLGLGSQQGGHQRLAHAALAADNGINVLDGSTLSQRGDQILRLGAGSTVLAAGGTVMGAVFSAHKKKHSFSV